LKKRSVKLKISLMGLKFLLDEIEKRPDGIENLS
jgi:hypothetical protein